MQNMSKLLLLSAFLSFVATEANASETIAINPTNKAPLINGRCDKDEWQAATKFELPAQVSIYLMHDKDSLYVCAKGKAEDYTVIDLYIEHAETGHLHHFHLSAQMGESVLTDKGWSESETWKLKDWTGFWVPYFGYEDTENGRRAKFFKGSHREIQVLRKKFAGNSWNMMIGVSAINHEGNSQAEFFYPEKAVDNDKLTWGKFSFSE